MSDTKFDNSGGRRPMDEIDVIVNQNGLAETNQKFLNRIQASVSEDSAEGSVNTILEQVKKQYNQRIPEMLKRATSITLVDLEKIDIIYQYGTQGDWLILGEAPREEDEKNFILINTYSSPRWGIKIIS